MSEQERKIEAYKREIIAIIKMSTDLEYIVAVYSFARGYPNKTERD